MVEYYEMKTEKKSNFTVEKFWKDRTPYNVTFKVFISHC